MKLFFDNCLDELNENEGRNNEREAIALIISTIRDQKVVNQRGLIPGASILSFHSAGLVAKKSASWAKDSRFSLHYALKR